MSDTYLSPEEVLTNLGVAYDYKGVKAIKWHINPDQSTDNIIVTSVYELGLGDLLTSLEIEANMRCVHWGKYLVLARLDPQEIKIVIVRNGEDCKDPIFPAKEFKLTPAQVASWHVFN